MLKFIMVVVIVAGSATGWLVPGDSMGRLSAIWAIASVAIVLASMWVKGNSASVGMFFYKIFCLCLFAFSMWVTYALTWPHT